MTTEVQSRLQRFSAARASIGFRRGYALWLFLALALVPLISLFMHFQGRMVLGWDSEPPIRPDFVLRHSLSAWDGRAYFGQANPFQLTAVIPIALVYAAIYHLGGLALADKAMLCILFVLPAFTAFWFSRAIGLRKPLATCAGLCYALSPLLFIRYYVPLFNIQLVYGMLPAIAASWVQLLTRPRIAGGVLALAAAEIGAISGGTNIAFWIVPHLFCCLLSAVWLVYRRAKWRTTLSRTFIAFSVVLCLNAFWLFPQVIFGVTSGRDLASQQINRNYSVGARQDLTQNSSLSYTLRLQSKAQTAAGDKYGPYWTYAGVLQNPLCSAFYFLWFGLALLAVVKRCRDWRVIALAIALSGALYIMKGEAPPLQQPLNMLYGVTLIGTVFRDGFDKVAPIAALALAVLVPLGLNCVFSIVGRRYRTYAFGALALLLFAGSFPYWTGQMFMARANGPSLSVIPPRSTLSYFRALDKVHGRIVFTPSSNNALLLATAWGFFGPNVYGRMTTAPFVAMPTSTLNTGATNVVSGELYQAINTNNIGDFVHYGRLASVGAVLVAGDVRADYYGGQTASQVADFLSSVPGVRRVSAEGPYELWRMPWAQERPGALTRERAASYNTDIDAAIYLSKFCGPATVALIARPVPGSCRIKKDGRGDVNAVVYPESLATSWTYWNGMLTGTTHDHHQPNTEIYARTVPKDTLAVSIDGTPLLSGTYRLDLETGNVHTVRALRILGNAMAVSIADPIVVNGPADELAQSGIDLDFSGGRDVVSYVRSHVSRAGEVGFEIDAVAKDASYGVAVVDRSTQQTLGTEDGLRAPRSLAAVRLPHAGDYDIYVYYHPSAEDATLRVAKVRLWGLHAGRLLGSFMIPKMLLRSTHQRGGYAVSRGVPEPIGRFDGVHVKPESRETLLVQNYQYDRLWVALLWVNGHAMPIALQHAMVDGFKNGWLLPANTAGVVSVFYANDAVAAFGVLMAMACVVGITVAVIRERKLRDA